MKRFILILQFLTRIPIKLDVGFDDEFYKSIVYFPLVGLVIGILTYLIGWVSILLFQPFICAIIITLAGVLITGGLHIDGLGDTFDAIYSYREKEKMLEIMKDSRLGTNSLLAIMFVLLLKIGFIYSIISNNSLWVIIFMPMIARLGVMLLTYKTVTPRAKGMGNLFIGKLTTSMLITAIIYTLLIVSIITKLIFLMPNIILIKVLCSAIVVFIFIILFKNHIYKKIDGVTGDILGCGIELSELVYLIYIYLLIFMFI